MPENLSTTLRDGDVPATITGVTTTYNGYPLGSMRLGVNEIADPIDRILHRLIRISNNANQWLATAEARNAECPCMRHGNTVHKLSKEAAASLAELEALQLIVGAK